MADEVLHSMEYKISADPTELQAELQKATAEIEALEKKIAEQAEAFAAAAEKTKASERTRLSVLQQVTEASINLTGTESERRILAVDKQYASLMGKLRKYGMDTTELEKAIAARKAAILKEIEDRTAASTTKQAEALKGATKSAGQAAEGLLSVSKASGVLRGAMAAAGAQSSQMSGGLQLLGTATNPVILGVTAAAAAVFAYTERLRQATEENRRYLDAAAGLRLGVKALRNELAEKKGLLDSAEIQNEIDKLATLEGKALNLSLELREMRAGTFAFLEGVDPKSTIAAKERELRLIQDEIAAAQEMLPLLREKIGLKKEEEAAEKRLAEQKKKQAEFDAELKKSRADEAARLERLKDYLAALDEELVKQKDLGASTTDYAKSVAVLESMHRKEIAALRDLGMTEEQAIERTKDLAEARLQVLNAEEARQRAEDVKKVHKELEDALLDLTGTATQKQLAALDERFAGIIEKARAHGEDVTAIEKAVQAERTKIIEAASAREIAALDAAKMAMVGMNEEGVRSFEKLTTSVADTEEAIRAMIQAIEDGWTTMRLNDGKGWGPNSAFSIDPGGGFQAGVALSPASFGGTTRSSPTVIVNNNSRSKIGAPESAVGADGSDVVVIPVDDVASDISRGGKAARAIERRYGLSPRAGA